MSDSRECKAHGGAAASFTCASCGDAFCPDCLGVNDQGRSVCISCSIKQSAEKATSTSKEDVNQRRQRVAEIEAQREKARDSRKWLVALLIIAVPIIGFEIFLLSRGAPVEVTADDAARTDVASSIVVITSLNHYRDENGEYPLMLDRLVPEFWNKDRAALLAKFEYRRVDPERFELRKLEPSPPAGGDEIRGALPASMEAGDNIGEILQQVEAVAIDVRP